MGKNKCASCGATENLQIHHWLYLNTIRKQKSWTTILCRACHQKLHHNHGVGHGAKNFGCKPRVVNVSSRVHLKVMQQKQKLEEESGRVVSIAKALDALLGVKEDV